MLAKSTPSTPKTRVSRAASSAVDPTGADSKQSKRGANLQPLEVAALPNALLTLRTAGAVGGLSVSTIYRKAAIDPTFPKLIRIGARCTRMRAGDWLTWLAAQAGTVDTVQLAG